jgi:hypothetical protein
MSPSGGKEINMKLSWWFSQGKQWGSVNTLTGEAIKAAFLNIADDLPWGEAGYDALESFRAGAVAAQLEGMAR